MEVGQKAEALAIRQPEHRAQPRFAVDEDSVLLVARGEPLACRILDLSLTGCRLRTREPFPAFARMRVEISFRINGIAFRFLGVVQWNDGRNLMGIRFVDVIQRRQEELAEVIGEVEAAAAARVQKKAEERGEAEKQAQEPTEKQAPAAPPESALPQDGQTHAKRDRRSQARHEVDTSAAIFLVKIGSKLEGRILDLSVSGCRIRTAERFPVGIYERVETEFCLDGLPFRLGGVTQAIHDQNTVGIRFLDLSERKREQVQDLIEEIGEMRGR